MLKQSKPARVAAPLPAPTTGDKSFDAAVLVIQKEFLYTKKPHVAKAFKRLLANKPGDDKRLASLLVPEIFDHGPSEVFDTDAATKRMSPKDRKAWRVANDAVRGEHMNRERYFGWVVFQMLNSELGCNRLIDALLDPSVAFEGKYAIAEDLARGDAPMAAGVLAARFPPKRWATLIDLGLADGLIDRVVEHIARERGAKAFPELAKLAANDDYRGGVLAGIDHASRTQGYGRFGDAELAKQQPIDERWVPIALATLTSKDAHAVVAAIDVLLDVPPRAEWKPAIVKAKKYLDRKAESSAVEDLLEAIDALSAKPESPEPEPADKPLPPLKRKKAPAPERPKLTPIAKLAAQIDEMLAAAELTTKRGVLVQPAFHVLTKRVADDAIPLGGTKIGGLPDLPAGTPWPEHGKVAMSFIAQFDLAAVTKLARSALPAKGLLMFFVDDEPFGEHYLEAASILYFAKPGKLVRTSPPPTLQAARKGEPERTPYATCAVTLVPTLTLPSPSNPATKALSKAERARYEEHVELPQHHLGQLLGFREHGYDAENPASAQFLFRITSDAQADMSFGDEDPLDFYVPKQGLAKADFRKAYPYCGD